MEDKKAIRHLKCIGLFWLFCFSFFSFAQNSDSEVEIGNKASLKNSIAVLPFENLSPSPDDAYFAEGIHEEILSQLTKVCNINPISRTSILRNTDDGKSIAEIASILNVETIMTGSVRYVENRFNISVSLIDASTNTQLWSEVYDRELSDIFVTQAEIVRHIVTVIGVEVTADEQKRIDKMPTHSLEAYTLYLKARALIQNLNPRMPPKFYLYLNQAIAVDPDFALAHAVKASGYGISHIYNRQLNGLTFDEMESVTLEHAKIAVGLDPNLSMAYMAQAFIYYSNLHGTAAKQAFERALQLGPNDVDILDEYALFLIFLGEDEEAARMAKRAVMLAPKVAHYLSHLGNAYMYAGNPTAAAEQYRLAIPIQSSAGRHLSLGLMEILLGNKTEALKELQIADQLENSINPNDVARLAYAYSRLGLSKDAMRVHNTLKIRTDKGQIIRTSAWALSFLAIGEIEKAFEIITQNPNEGIRYLQVIKSNIMKDPILEQPRFVALRNQIGFLD